MSALSLRLKTENMILRWPGLSPSRRDGMERCRSAKEKRISSWLMKSEYFTSSTLWSKKVPCAHPAERAAVHSSAKISSVLQRKAAFVNKK